MAALNEQTLQYTLAAFRRGLTFQGVADELGSSRRMLFRWKARSARRDHNFFMIDAKSGAPGYWHQHVDRILYHENVFQVDPDFIDATDNEIESITGSAENRYLHDAKGERIRRVAEEEPDMSDVEQLEAAARERPAHPRPDGVMQIMRDNPNDPPEQISGPRPARSEVEILRSHPRRSDHMEPLLKPAVRPNSGEPALRLDVSTIGSGVHGTPPPEGRFTMASETISAARRRAGTISFDGLSVRRW